MYCPYLTSLFWCDYKAIISISYFKWGMHVTKCYYRTHSEFIDFMLSSPNDVSLYLILYYSLVFTSPLPFQTLTCYPHTAAVIGQCPFCKRTHSTSPTKKLQFNIKKALNTAIKRSQHIPDLLMPAWVQLIFTSVSDSRDMSMNIMHYYSSSDKKNMILCVFVHLCVCVA